jgi:hypothetical protein
MFFFFFFQRGHHVTTIRYDTEQRLMLPDIGPNHKEYVLHLNNSDGTIPYVSKGENGIFEIPKDLLWEYGLSYELLFHVKKDAPHRIYQGRRSPNS